MRALDWSTTPLGPVEHWPQSLLTSISTLLDCAFPLIIWWGPKLALLYNDEYAAILGPHKHPAALGREGASVWAEIWDVVGPMLAQVMERGEATRSRDLFLAIDRGYTEETYFSFSYSPIHAEGGKIGGVFCPVIETTQKVIGERRLRTLRDLAASCQGAGTESDLYQCAARALAHNPRDIPFALLYRLEFGESGPPTALLEACVGIGGRPIEPGSRIAPERLVLDPSQAAPWSMAEVVMGGAPVLITDLEQHLAPLDELPRGAWAVPPTHAFSLPIMLPGHGRPRAILVAAVNPMRALDEDHRTFFQLLASQLAAGLSDTLALAEERRRAAALAELDRAKTVFFSNISHEFRTPLTLMLAPLEDALQSAEMPGALRTELELVHRNAQRLLKLVNTLLDFARIEAGRIEASYQPTDLAAFTAELASVFRSAIERAGLTLRIDCPPLPAPVFVDRDMWEKIVLNLLSNALKFTFEGSITVAVHATGNRAELRVADTGVGIRAADIGKLFQRFQRVQQTRARTQEGSGIGLALVEELARLHGGVVSVQSEEGRGSSFTVSLPLGSVHLPAGRIRTDHEGAERRSNALPYIEEALRWVPAATRGTSYATETSEPAARGADETSAETSPRILIADDNNDMGEYLQRLLQPHYRVERVRDGRVALERVRVQPPDLLLSDVMMPGLDGFQLLAAVRGDAQLRTLPVILLSARAGEEARIEGLAAGADDYITKPFSARELSARVASQLQLARVRREAEQAIRQRGEQYGTLLRQAPMGVFLVDAGLRIREINPAALPAFDQPQTALIGSRLEDIVTDQWGETTGRQVVEVFRRTLETGESYVVPEWAHQRADRGVVEYYHWRIDRIPLHDGTFGVVCYFRDISEHVAARETLRHADRQKDEFLTTLAHELRNPLAPLRNGLQILKLAQADAAAAARARDMMERQIVQMVRLIDDLLEVSRISHGKISLSRERVELSAIIHRSVETSRPSIDARHHTLELQLPGEPLPLDADPVRLAQVLSNLLNNAAKFTPEGGRIRIDAHRESGAGGEREEIAICVADTGIGMSAELLPRIFEPFLQGDRSLERTSSGLGIGLTLVQRIVELHGGRVEARSAGSGLGSEFIIRLPAARPATATGKPAPALAAEAAPARKRRILVADDNQDAADTLALMLSTSGDEVHTVYDGAAAAEAAFRYRPDIILLDIAMPKLNGYDVAQRIRAELGEGSSPLLIALTGFGAESDRERAQRAGFDAHLVKPVHFDQLAQLFTRLETRPGSTLH